MTQFHTVPAIRLAVAGTLVILLLYFPAQLTQLLNPGFGIWFTEAFVFLGMAFVLVRMTGRDPVRYTGLPWPGAGASAYGFAFGAVNFIALALPLQIIATALFPQSWSEFYDSARILKDKDIIDLALVIGGVTIAAPIAEEYFFRGVLQRSLQESGAFSPLMCVVVSGAIFSAFHLDPVGFVPRTELGILFGWLFLRTGSIWPGVMAHAANNIVSVVLFYVASSGGEAETELGAAQIRQLALFAVVGLTALGGLLLLASKRPQLLADRSPPVGDPLPPRSFYALAWPWALAAALSVALLFALDHRGISLNQTDARNPLPEAAKAAQEQSGLMELRTRARRGEVPLSDYTDARRSLIDRFKPQPE